jgi:hypothetical protein
MVRGIGLLIALGSVCTPLHPISNCEPWQSRCEGVHLETCSPQRRWRPVQDCSQIEPGTWTCQRDQCVRVTP